MDTPASSVTRSPRRKWKSPVKTSRTVASVAGKMETSTRVKTTKLKAKLFKILNFPKLIHRKIRFNWNARRDIQLLNAVLEHRPWEYGDAVYPEVLQRLGFPITHRQCEQHYKKLSQLYKRKDAQALRRGTEEEYNERDQLLQEVTELEELAFAQLQSNVEQSLDVDHIFTESEILELPEAGPSRLVTTPVKSKGVRSSAEFTTPKRKKYFKKEDKEAGDTIRKRALDNSLLANTAADPNPVWGGKRVDFEAMVNRKAEAEKERFESKQDLKLKEAELKRTIEAKKIEMEERLALPRLELEHEDKERQREFLREQQQCDFEQ